MAKTEVGTVSLDFVLLCSIDKLAQLFFCFLIYFLIAIAILFLLLLFIFNFYLYIIFNTCFLVFLWEALQG